MDVFGSTPAIKLDKLIKYGNRNFENKLRIHNTLILDNSKKINVTIVTVQDLKVKLDLTFKFVLELKEQMKLLVINFENKLSVRDALVENVKNTIQNVRDLGDKIDSKFHIIQVLEDKIKLLEISSVRMDSEFKIVQDLGDKLKSLVINDENKLSINDRITEDVNDAIANLQGLRDEIDKIDSKIQIIPILEERIKSLEATRVRN